MASCCQCGLRKRNPVVVYLRSSEVGHFPLLFLLFVLFLCFSFALFRSVFLIYVLSDLFFICFISIAEMEFKFVFRYEHSSYF
jgi:hypothetical protein